MAFLTTYVEVLIASVALLLAIFYFRKKRDPRYPPGPPAWPIVGNLFQLGDKPHQSLRKWAEEYGPVFSLKRGTEDVIVLNDHKIIKDIFQEASANGRSTHPIWLALANGNNGVLMNEGAHWEQQRRFTLRKLRDFGFSKTSMQSLIFEEVNSMIKWFEKRLDKPFSGNKIFNGAVVNSLWNIMSGERQEWDGDKPLEMLTATEGILESFNHMNATGLFAAPFLRHIAPKFFGWTGFVKNMAKLTNVAYESVERHAKVLDENNPQDFIDHYIMEIKNTKDPNSSFYKATGDTNLRLVLPDLFLAGSETTSHTLEWAMLLMAQHQPIQQKLCKELDGVIGRSREPLITDRPKLPYTEAFILEVLRRTSMSVTGVPHRMLQDAVFHGYFFPKDTAIMANIMYVNNDPMVWGDPENFRPERFLSPDGSKVLKNEALISFSLGKRQCLGESLAKDTLFLFVTGILQKFHIKRDPNDDGTALKNIVPTSKMLNAPDPFKIIFSLRE